MANKYQSSSKAISVYMCAGERCPWNQFTKNPRGRRDNRADGKCWVLGKATDVSPGNQACINPESTSSVTQPGRK